jgi:hypothetical protein
MDNSKPVPAPVPNVPSKEPVPTPERTWGDVFRENKTIIIIILLILAIALWYFFFRGTSTSAVTGQGATVDVINHREM